MEKNLNLLIDLMEFLSFWMVAPEFLGESRMRKIETQIMKMEAIMPGLIFGFLGIITGFSFSIAGVKFHSFAVWNYFVFSFMLFYILTFSLYKNKIRTYLAVKIFRPFFSELSVSGTFRQKFLKTGALLFAFSFGLKICVYLFC